MKKNVIIKNLKAEIVNQLNGIIENVNDIDELRTVLRMILMFNQPGDIKEMLNCEPEDESDENQQTEFDGGDEIGDDHHDEGYPDEPDEDTLLEKVHYNDTEPAHYNDTEPAKKPELPQGNPSGECWVITRTYGFTPDGPGYDVSGDDLVYGLYDSWGPAIQEFKNIAERTGKTIEEGKDFYKISCWNPATGTAGYILKKHGVNGTSRDEDEFCTMFYSMAAELTVNIMEVITKGSEPRADRIDSAADMISSYMQEQVIPCVQDACRVFGCWDMSYLPDTVKNAVDMAFAASESMGKMLLNIITR